MHASRKRPASAMTDGNDLIATTLADEPRAAAPSKLCVSCLQSPAQTEKKYKHKCKNCWKQSQGLAVRSAPGTARKACPDCARNGQFQPAQSAAWCKGYCWHHARARGFHLAPRTKVRTKFEIRSRGLRRLAQLRHAIRCDRFLRAHSTTVFGLRGRRATDAQLTSKQGGRRRVRCEEVGCKRRAQATYGTMMLCKSHARWHRCCERLSNYMKTTRPLVIKYLRQRRRHPESKSLSI